MICPRCKSDKVNVQMVTDTKLKNKHHSIFYWVFIGWWLELILWVCLTVPRLLVAVFGHKKQKIVQKHKSMAVCQDCGHSWNV